MEPLFTCESIINEDEYGAMVMHFPSFYWACVKNVSLLVSLLLIIMGLVNESFLESLITALFMS